MAALIMAAGTAAAAACTGQAAMAQVAMGQEACTVPVVTAVATGAAWVHPCMGDHTADPPCMAGVVTAVAVTAAAMEATGAAA